VNDEPIFTADSGGADEQMRPARASAKRTAMHGTPAGCRGRTLEDLQSYCRRLMLAPCDAMSVKVTASDACTPGEGNALLRVDCESGERTQLPSQRQAMLPATALLERQSSSSELQRWAEGR
jgi:hypothetical protein